MIKLAKKFTGFTRPGPRAIYFGPASHGYPAGSDPFTGSFIAAGSETGYQSPVRQDIPGNDVDVVRAGDLVPDLPG
ncbi:MAG: hypothetical protein A4E38_01308 [Methanoregulaceae archaeon PtaB.Bin108]|nr:MAG: hypothetical protein A4E38_01308 [Methanoregulaceae archaeon PtaB.Bin108]